MTCPFCQIKESQIVVENAIALAIRDAFPVSKGHTLVVPKQHVGTIFELPDRDQEQLWQLVAQVRKVLIHEQSPAGFNVGVNDGNAAGQTVAHAHIHVIPRQEGDVPDPRGGVRWVIPDKAAYWEGET